MGIHHRALAATAAAALILSACGDDDPAADPTETEEPSSMDSEATDDATTPEPAGPTATVTAIDYGYPDVEAEYAAGTTIVLDNQSEAEVHEILAFRIKDDETRSVGELLGAGEEEFGAAVEMRGVALAPPQSDSTGLPAPPLVLEQPGRYAFVCFIPTGAPPDEVMQAVADFIEAGAPEDGAPAYPETGPPHAANNMWAEVTVTA